MGRSAMVVGHVSVLPMSPTVRIFGEAEHHQGFVRTFIPAEELPAGGGAPDRNRRSGRQPTWSTASPSTAASGQHSPGTTLCSSHRNTDSRRIGGGHGANSSESMRTSIFPTLAPLSIPRNASTARSRPSTIVSWGMTAPVRSQLDIRTSKSSRRSS